MRPPEPRGPYDAYYMTGTGQVLTVHRRTSCSGVCPIHAVSDHPLANWPTNWNAPNGIMERECPHGQLHPDPDDFTVRIVGVAWHADDCDGCCQGAERPSVGGGATQSCG